MAGAVPRVVHVDDDEARATTQLHSLAKAETRPGFICADISGGKERVSPLFAAQLPQRAFCLLMVPSNPGISQGKLEAHPCHLPPFRRPPDSPS